MGVLLFFIGLAIVTLIDLAIPLIVIKKAPPITHKKLLVWLIALASGLFGFIMITIVLPAFDFLTGAIFSAIWVVIDYFVIKKNAK